MNRSHLLNAVARLVLGAACLVAVSCGGEMLRTGRAPVYLVIGDISTTAGGGGDSSGSLLSDVTPVFNDIASVTIRSEAKNPTAPTAAINAVELTRYRVTFRRADGRNAPGVDVPYSFDGALSVFIAPGGSGIATFDIVRHQAKIEPPLANLAGGGGLLFISTIAEITFYGHDQNGNEVSVTGRKDIQFADFADE
jgi:hypothetical protein